MNKEVEEFARLTSTMNKRFVTVTQAAKFLRCSKQKLNNDRWLSKGCPYYKLHGKIYYDINDLKKYFKENMQRIVPGGNNANA